MTIHNHITQSLQSGDFGKRYCHDTICDHICINHEPPALLVVGIYIIYNIMVGIYVVGIIYIIFIYV